MLQYLKPELLQEVITQKEFKEYRTGKKSTELPNVDVKAYKPNLKILKNIFRKLNKGKFARTIIFNYKDIKLDKNAFGFSGHDQQIIDILELLDYEVSNESYMLGICQKNNKNILINDIITALKNKTQTAINSMEKAYEKSKNEVIKKQLDAIDTLSKRVDYKYTIPYKLNQHKDYKIVLSIQPRLIASQSTKVGWTSCMNLDEGAYRHKAITGIQEGVVVAYLAKLGDEKTLNNPTARVLLKPLKDIEGDENEIIWKVDEVYGTAPNDFKTKVEKIFENFNSKKESIFKLSDKIYQDKIKNSHNNLSDEKYSEIVKKISKIFNEKSSETITHEVIKMPLSELHIACDRYNVERNLDYSDPEKIEIIFNKLSKLGLLNTYYLFSKSSLVIKNCLVSFSDELILKILSLNSNTKDYIKYLTVSQKLYILKNYTGNDYNIKKEVIKALPALYIKKLKKEGHKIDFYHSGMTEQDIVDAAINNTYKTPDLLSEYQEDKKLSNKQISKIILNIFNKLISLKINPEKIQGLAGNLATSLITKEILVKLLDNNIIDKRNFYFDIELLKKLGANEIIKYLEQHKINYQSIWSPVIINNDTENSKKLLNYVIGFKLGNYTEGFLNVMYKYLTMQQFEKVLEKKKKIDIIDFKEILPQIFYNHEMTEQEKIELSKKIVTKNNIKPQALKSYINSRDNTYKRFLYRVFNIKPQLTARPLAESYLR